MLWLGIPLMIGTLITLMMDGQGGAKPQGFLLIADQDQTILSRLMISAYSQGELAEIIIVRKVTAEQGAREIEAGDASGFLLIPKGFTRAFLSSEPNTLVLKTNPSQTILPGIIREVTSILLDLGSYAHALFGEEIEQITAGIEDDLADTPGVANIALALQTKIERIVPSLLPPAIDIVVAAPEDDGPAVPIALLFLPGITLMAIMFAANGLASDFWNEREQGTLKRLWFAPGQVLSFVGGKAVAAGLLIAGISGFALLIGFLYHAVPLSRLPSSLLWAGISGTALFAWFSTLQMMGKTRRAANLISSMLLFPLLLAGGSFFPFAALPDGMAAFGRLTPNGFVVDQLTNEMIAAQSWSIAPVNWLIIAVMAITGLLVCSWRLRAGFARG